MRRGTLYRHGRMSNRACLRGGRATLGMGGWHFLYWQSHMPLKNLSKIFKSGGWGVMQCSLNQFVLYAQITGICWACIVGTFRCSNFYLKIKKSHSYIQSFFVVLFLCIYYALPQAATLITVLKFTRTKLCRYQKYIVSFYQKNQLKNPQCVRTLKIEMLPYVHATVYFFLKMYVVWQGALKYKIPNRQ